MGHVGFPATDKGLDENIGWAGIWDNPSLKLELSRWGSVCRSFMKGPGNGLYWHDVAPAWPAAAKHWIKEAALAMENK
jgi:hypothetical protein